MLPTLPPASLLTQVRENGIYHHGVVFRARISQTLSIAIGLYHPSPPTDLLNYNLCPYRSVEDKFLLVVQHLHVRLKKTSLVSSSLLLQQFPKCIISLIWMVLEIEVSWPYSCCFVRCCRQDLFNIARRILVQFSSSFFSIISVHVMHPYCRIATTRAWKNDVLSYWIS